MRQKSSVSSVGMVVEPLGMEICLYYCVRMRTGGYWNEGMRSESTGIK